MWPLPCLSSDNLESPTAGYRYWEQSRGGGLHVYKLSQTFTQLQLCTTAIISYVTTYTLFMTLCNIHVKQNAIICKSFQSIKVLPENFKLYCWQISRKSRKIVILSVQSPKTIILKGHNLHNSAVKQTNKKTQSLHGLSDGQSLNQS